MNHIEYSPTVATWCQAHLPAIGDLLDLLDIPFASALGISGVAAGTHAYLHVTHRNANGWVTTQARIVLLNDSLQSRHISIK